MAPKNLTPEDIGAGATVVAMAGTVLWFILRPFIIWAHRMFGKKAFAAEWRALAETRTAVQQIKEEDLPEVKAACQAALASAQRTEQQVDRITNMLINKAIFVMGPTDVGKPEQP